MAEYYSFCKEFYVKMTLHRLIWWSAYSFWAGAVAYCVPYFAYGSGVVSTDGKSDDLWAAGTVSLCILCIAHHFQLFFTVRHWHWYLALWSLFSFCELPGYMVIVDQVVGVNMNLRQYSEIVLGTEAPLFGCMLLLGVSAIVFPVYAFKTVKMVIVFPEYHSS